MYSKKPDDKNWSYKGHTIFIMAARKGKDSFKVPPMEFDGEDQPKTAKVRQILGNELKDYIIGMNNNLYKQAPNSKESDLIHGLFKKRKCKYNLFYSFSHPRCRLYICFRHSNKTQHFNACPRKEFIWKSIWWIFDG